MKYVVHLTTSADDDKHIQARTKSGTIVYAVYWMIAEKIAAQMNPPSMVTKLTLPVKKWAHYCEIRPSLLSKFIKTLHEVNLISAQSDGNLLTIEMPNLLKYADEYGKRILRKSGQTPDNVPTNSGVKYERAGDFDYKPLFEDPASKTASSMTSGE